MDKITKSWEWFEDYQADGVFISEPIEFTEEGIIEFAKSYDPQPFHVDRKTAETSPFRGIIASGTHLFAAVWGGMIRAGFLNGRAMGAPGVELRFLKPVRPGDILQVTTKVRESRNSQSHPDRGYVAFDSEALNQKGEIVLTLSFEQIIPTHPTS